MATRATAVAVAVAAIAGAILVSRGFIAWHAAVATMAVLLVVRGIWGARCKSPAPSSKGDAVQAEKEHPYYSEIDKQTTRFRSESVVNRSESRRRATYRSHDPRRWRARLFYREPEQEEEGAPAPLFDWANAQRALDALESRHGMIVQRPPLAYSDTSSCRLSKEAGCEWYFAISDFDEAILTGTVTIKHIDGDQTVTIDLRDPTSVEHHDASSGERNTIDLSLGAADSACFGTPPRKPLLVKKRSPSGVMDFPRISRDVD